jgi:phosphoribosylformylglycinamidine cyclo-ligase
LRSNGYSLARAALLDRAGRSLDDPAWKGAHHSLGDELLVPSVIYAPAMLALRKHVDVHAFAHITGGGIAANLDRVLPKHCDAVITRGRWEVPRIFSIVQEAGQVTEAEMEKVFNLGLGMVAVVPNGSHEAAIDAIRMAGHDAWLVGEVTDGHGHTRLV